MPTVQGRRGGTRRTLGALQSDSAMIRWPTADGCRRARGPRRTARWRGVEGSRGWSSSSGRCAGDGRCTLVSGEVVDDAGDGARVGDGRSRHLTAMDGGNAEGLQEQSLRASRDIRTSLYSKCEDSKWRATAGAAAEVEIEGAAQSLHPRQGGAGTGRCRRRLAGRGRRHGLGHDPMSMVRVGGEQAVIAKQVDSRSGDQGGETGDEVQRLGGHWLMSMSNTGRCALHSGHGCPVSPWRGLVLGSRESYAASRTWRRSLKE